MVRGLKKRFPELEGIVLNPENLERRIEMLELMDNDYFVLGSETAVARLEAAGVTVPPMDLEQYARDPNEDVQATKPAQISGGVEDDSKAMRLVGPEADQAEGEASTQGASADVAPAAVGDRGKAKETETSVEAAAAPASVPAPAPASVPSPVAAPPRDVKADLKAKMKAALKMGKENVAGASSAQGKEPEPRGPPAAPSARPNGT
ncbi:hypothetical protein MMC07_006435 [Pseudocyphellaria aurata]|nr:hypothetical protein [Pseudocyphellaria aurata]